MIPGRSTHFCKLCGLEKDENQFPKEHGEIRRYICWACRAQREQAQQKLRLLSSLGWKCACCGETMPAFLTLEHKLGRVEHKGLTTFQIYARAAKEGWPTNKYELLCMNCNFAKGHFGECPHRKGITPVMAIEQLRQEASAVVESSFTTGKITDSQKQALDSGRHLGPIARWGPKDESENAQLLGLTPKQYEQLKEILKGEKKSS
jgi:hypothetical protein